jgi:hypothetical protein
VSLASGGGSNPPAKSKQHRGNLAKHQIAFNNRTSSHHRFLLLGQHIHCQSAGPYPTNLPQTQLVHHEAAYHHHPTPHAPHPRSPPSFYPLDISSSTYPSNILDTSLLFPRNAPRSDGESSERLGEGVGGGMGGEGGRVGWGLVG